MLSTNDEILKLAEELIALNKKHQVLEFYKVGVITSEEAINILCSRLQSDVYNFFGAIDDNSSK
jgi:hypothetical protein